MRAPVAAEASPVAAGAWLDRARHRCDDVAAACREPQAARERPPAAHAPELGPARRHVLVVQIARQEHHVHLRMCGRRRRRARFPSRDVVRDALPVLGSAPRRHAAPPRAPRHASELVPSRLNTAGRTFCSLARVSTSSNARNESPPRMGSFSRKPTWLSVEIMMEMTFSSSLRAHAAGRRWGGWRGGGA